LNAERQNSQLFIEQREADVSPRPEKFGDVERKWQIDKLTEISVAHHEHIQTKNSKNWVRQTANEQLQEAQEDLKTSQNGRSDPAFEGAA
jgi:hypothetical protein